VSERTSGNLGVRRRRLGCEHGAEVVDLLDDLFGGTFEDGARAELLFELETNQSISASGPVCSSAWCLPRATHLYILPC